jgi:hypothetical protein
MVEINSESFRFPVTFSKRQDFPDPAPGATGLVETLVDSFTAFANVEPLTSWASYNSIFVGPNGDKAITHRVTTFWSDRVRRVDNTWLVQRTLILPNGPQTENLRIWRILEVNNPDYQFGQFVQFECTLENEQSP